MTQDYRPSQRAGRTPTLALVAALFAQAFVALPALAGDSVGNGANGGSEHVKGGEGFACGGGNTYQMINGVARCTQPTAVAAVSASCGATVMTQGACTYSFPTATSGSKPVIASASPGYSGTGQATCNNGSWGTLSASCAANGCSGTTTEFGACSFSVPGLASGNSVVVPTSTSTYTGSVTASCLAGSLTIGSQSCNPTPPPPPAPCAPSTLTWGSSCNASTGTTDSGTSVTLTNAESGFNGAATFICTNGNWSSAVSASCSVDAPPPPPPPTGCAATSMSWGLTPMCVGTLGAASSGTSQTATNIASGETGLATYVCSNGTWTAQSTNCAASTPPSCPASPAASQTLTCQDVGYPVGDFGTVIQTRSLTCNASTGWSWSAGVWTTTTDTCDPEPAPLAVCPANIWVTSSNVSIPLTVPNPTDKLPNGDAYCLYSKVSGDRYAGAFDRVTGKAVDFFPVFKEVLGHASSDTTNSSFAFKGYEPRYSTNLHIQGAYCSNNLSDPAEKGYYPGTCKTGGHGSFEPMCFVDMDPNSSLGLIMAGQGIGLRMQDGGSLHWMANTYAPYTVNDGTNMWSIGDLWSASYGFYDGGRPNACTIGNPNNEMPTPTPLNPPPLDN